MYILNMITGVHMHAGKLIASNVHCTWDDAVCGEACDSIGRTSIILFIVKIRMSELTIKARAHYCIHDFALRVLCIGKTWNAWVFVIQSPRGRSTKRPRHAAPRFLSRSAPQGLSITKTHKHSMSSYYLASGHIVLSNGGRVL